ncbi:MAG: hypothetical protein ABIO94_01085 [Opitutaceae bacterium]
MSASRVWLVALFAVIGGIALFENRRIAGYRRELAAQSISVMRLQREIKASRETSSHRPDLAASASDLTADVTLDESPAEPVDPVEVDAWLKKAKQLRQAFADQPAQRIPQLALLNDREWVVAAWNAKFDTAEDIDRALAKARTAAKSRFVGHLYSAMQSYLESSQGSLPPDLTHLLPFLTGIGSDPDYDGGAPASDPAMLAQYELKASGKLDSVLDGVIVEERALVNEEFDHRIELERSEGTLTQSDSSTSVGTVEDDGMFERSVRAFAAAHGGAAPDTPADLIPFLEGPLAQSIKESITQQPGTPEGLRFFKRGVDKLLSKPAGR